MLKFNQLTKEFLNKVFILLLFLLLGLLATNQYILYEKIGFSNINEDPQDKAVRISKLYKDNEELKKQLGERQKQLSDLENSASSSTDLEKIINDDTKKYQIILGLKEVTGPGLQIEISHSLVLTQLVDLTNALRNIGAEALSINERRVVASTPLSGFVDQSNYVIKIIGQKEVLYEGVTRPGGVLDLITNGTATRSDNLILPKVN